MNFTVEQLDGNRLLAEWSWLCTEPMVLVARNGFGDLFLRTGQGGIVCLNIGKGTLDDVAESESGFDDLLRDPAQRQHWFAEPQLEAFAKRGLKPNNLQCIGFKVPVVFAESAAVPDNAYVAELYEQVSFLGDLHRHILDTADGGRVKLNVVDRPTTP